SLSGGVILHILYAFLLGARCAAKHDAVLILHAVANNSAAAMVACRREFIDRAFETVKRVGGPGDGHLKRFVVLVPTNFTCSHGFLPNESGCILNSKPGGFICQCATYVSLRCKPQRRAR